VKGQTAHCRRCGIVRQVKPERGIPEVCFDCEVVERHVVDLCGTMQGHWLHLTAGEAPCDRCLEARRLQDAQRRRAKGIPERRVAACGTDSGYSRHRRNGEDACGPCKRAHALANPSRRRTAA
jgi:hypothetical protein